MRSQQDFEDFLRIFKDKKQGEKLQSGEAKILAELLIGLIGFAATGHTQKPRYVYSHYTLQSMIGDFLATLGYTVSYEIPFQLEGWQDRSVRFDVVAESENEINVVEIKDEITPRDLGQVHGYANILQLGKQKAKVYLGTDALNWRACIDGVTGETIKELMEREGLGLILADKFFLFAFDNYQQLMGEEMPLIFTPLEEAE